MHMGGRPKVDFIRFLIFLCIKVFHGIIDTVSENILDFELFFDYGLKPLSYQFQCNFKV